VGYGDIVPETQAEVLLTMIAEVVGCFVFGIIIGTLGSMVMSGQMLEEEVTRKLGASAVASFWAAFLTEIYLCNVFSGQTY
jgi:hypothetical protein